MQVRFRDLPILTKSYLCIIGLILLPLVLVGIFVNVRISGITLAKAYDDVFLVLRHTEDAVTSMTDSANALSLRLLSNTTVQDMLRNEPDPGKTRSEMYWTVDSWITSAIIPYSYIQSIHLYDAEGDVFSRGSTLSPADAVTLAKAYGLKGRAFWNASATEWSYYRAIMDWHRMGRYIGVERISIREESIYRAIDSRKYITGSRFYLLDATGTVLSSSDRDAVHRFFGGAAFAQEALRSVEGSYPFTVDGTAYVVFHITFEGSGWKLIELIPRQSLTVLKTTVNTVLLVVILLAALFGILFPFIQNQYLIVPLRRLHKAIRRLKSGDLHPNLVPSSKDEIGEISEEFVQMAAQLDRTINDVYVSKLRQREAELLALESQIDPHFLFNTLDSIRWQAVRSKDYAVGEQIEALAEIIRYVMKKGDAAVPFREELRNLERYMSIQRKKYGDRIALDLHVDPELLDSRLPKLVLQPLVENAIVHGFEKTTKKGRIAMRAIREGDAVRITVTDDGAGTSEGPVQRLLTDPEEPDRLSALRNIRDRIRLVYGDDYDVTFRSAPEQGACVEVRIPYLPSAVPAATAGTEPAALSVDADGQEA